MTQSTTTVDHSQTIGGASGSAPPLPKPVMAPRLVVQLRLPDVYCRCLYVLVAACALGLFVPYVIARASSAMDGAQVVEKLRNPEAKARYNTEVACKSSLIALEATLSNTSTQGQAATDEAVRALTAYEKLRSMCSKLRSHVSVTGYSDSNVKWLWSALFLFLGLAAWVLPMPSSIEENTSVPSVTACRALKTAQGASSPWSRLNPNLLVLAVWVVYRFSPVLRNVEAYNTSKFDTERRLYSWTNLDVDPVGFAGQELLAFFVAVLIVQVWRKWNAENRYVDAHLRSSIGQLSASSVRSLSAEVARAFHVCIAASVLLCAAFVPYTRFFWRVVNDMGDERYYNQAVVVHLLWLATWLVVALPFGRLWLRWEQIRSCILGSDNTEFKSLADLEPVSRSHGAVSALVALLAALYPLIG